MALPDNFSASRHVKSTIIKTFNQEVKRFFRDLEPDTLDPDITVSRQSMYVACLVKNNDSMIVVVTKMLLFYIILRQAQDLAPAICGIILPTVEQSRKFKPQVTLYFRESLADVADGENPNEGEISFRLMDYESTTITKAKITQLANKIKLNFGGTTRYRWDKGKKMYSYTDKAKGYQLQILSTTEGKAWNLAQKVVDIQGHTADTTKFKQNLSGLTTSDENELYPYTPSNITILGEVKKEPKRRPICTVIFQYATLKLWAKGKPIILYDTTGRYLNTYADDD